MLIESFSGIRGIYGTDLDEKTIQRYVFSYCSLMKKKQSKESLLLVIGRDSRPSGQAVFDETVKVLTNNGCKCVDLGIATTPQTEFGVRQQQADGGIIITASHNEPEWNGFKFLGKDGAILPKNDSEELILNARSLKTKIKYPKTIDKNLWKLDLNEKYADYLIGFLKKPEILERLKMRILADSNGGSAIGTVRVLSRKLSVNLEMINSNHGQFVRKVEPNKQSLEPLFEKLQNGDVAFGFDCDADRVEVVLGGYPDKIISGQHLLALIINYELSRGLKSGVVVNEATSQMVADICKRHNSNLSYAPVGEANVVEIMEKTNSKIGGEGSSSGVIMLPNKCRDGILTMLKVLEVMAERRKGLDELIAELPKFYMERIDAKVKDPPKLAYDILREFKASAIKVEEFGGKKLWISDNCFIWMRQSKTEGNMLRIIVEGKEKEKSVQLIGQINELIKKS